MALETGGWGSGKGKQKAGEKKKIENENCGKVKASPG